MTQEPLARPGKPRLLIKLPGAALLLSPPTEITRVVDPTPFSPVIQGQRTIGPNDYTVEGQLAGQGNTLLGAKAALRDERSFVRWMSRLTMAIVFGPFVAGALVLFGWGAIDLIRRVAG
jgi:hypothetical protein